MKCPMKFADGSRRASQTECEREACAWWVKEHGDRLIASACAVAFMAVGDTDHPRSINGEFLERE